MRHLKFVILAAILLIGFALRFYNVKNIPTGFFADEAAIGYNSYSILTTGKDEHGAPYPFYFQSFGDWRTSVPIYSMIPFIAIFGPNEFSVRFTMVVYGTATILILYLFTRELFWKEERFKERIALTSSLFLAISPWHIHFSRSGFEFTTMPFYLLAGLVFLFRFLHRNQKNKDLILATIFFITSFYTAYVIQLVLLPLLFSIFILYSKTFLTKRLKLSIICLFIFILGLIPFLLAATSGQALTRFNSVSPLSHGKSIKEVLQPMINTYVDHFSLDFLFLKGDIDMPGHFISRHSVRGMGELYLFQLPLLFSGIIYLILKAKRIFIFLFLWLALYPVGSIMVAEGPFAHRSLFGVIPFQILSAIGLIAVFYFLFKLIKNLKLQVAISGILIVFFVIIGSLSIKDYINKYFNEYPLYSSDFWGWQDGPEEIINYFITQKDYYDQMYMSGEFNGGYIFIPFYDPKNLCQNKCKMGDIYRQPEIYDPLKKQLFALSPEFLSKSNYNQNFKVVKNVYYPNGNVAFKIGEIVK